MRRWWCGLCTRPTRSIGSSSASSLKQLSVGRHVAPIDHIIFVFSQPVYRLIIICCVLNKETANINFIVFDMTQPGLEPTIYRMLTITSPMPQSFTHTSPMWQSCTHTSPMWQSCTHTSPMWQSCTHTPPMWQSQQYLQKDHVIISGPYILKDVFYVINNPWDVESTPAMILIPWYSQGLTARAVTCIDRQWYRHVILS